MLHVRAMVARPLAGGDARLARPNDAGEVLIAAVLAIDGRGGLS
jgi:hypothetical protein